ncbi:MAG TPA: hypothetical protein VKA21_04140 [Candidatus Binatia bacterium]|nr:hypothetical protein [Candidatus Binatia bacterium]
MAQTVGSVVAIAVWAAGALAAPPGVCDAIVGGAGSAHVAVLSAFPAELAPLVERATVRERFEANGRGFYEGDLAGVRVILGIGGIGLLNAAASAETVLARGDVAAVVFSGVAGSPWRIGDVVVPAGWIETDTGTAYPANSALREAARGVADGVVLERCTPVPPPDGPTVCVAHRPAIVVQGVGESADPFGGTPLPCRRGGDDVFGCDIPAHAVAVDLASEEHVAEDMETAAVARVAAAHGVPWLGFRGVSDGAGDPLDLGGFPAQFFAYYPLAARNAAAGAIAFLGRIAELGDGRGVHRSICRQLARGRWSRAARLLRRDGRRP